MILSVEGLYLKYSDFSLHDISFSLQKGERISILGLSGSGKSSLLRSIYGLNDLESGQILFKDKPVDGPSKVLIPGHKQMKLVDQNFDLDNYHSVRENISNKILHLEKHDIQSKVDEILAVINLQAYQDQIAQTLSGGQKQRLALGRALAEIPEILLLDEPFSQIDLMNKFEIENRLYDYLNRHQITTIMVTHDYQDAFVMSDRILIMNEGEILRDVSKKKLYTGPLSNYEAMITGGYNEIKIENKIFHFRFNEFALEKKGSYSIEIELEIEDIIYLGAHIRYKVRSNKQSLVLESFEEKTFDRIYIRNKRYKFAD